MNSIFCLTEASDFHAPASVTLIEQLSNAQVVTDPSASVIVVKICETLNGRPLYQEALIELIN